MANSTGPIRDEIDRVEAVAVAGAGLTDITAAILASCADTTTEGAVGKEILDAIVASIASSAAGSIGKGITDAVVASIASSAAGSIGKAISDAIAAEVIRADAAYAPHA